MNSIEKSTIRSPSGKNEICAKIIIDDITAPFVFHGVTTVDELYTLSFHVYSESTGSVAIGSDSFDTESKWKYCTSEFTASGEDLRLYFTTTGIYYLYETKLESGNKATDWTPAPEDTTDDINSVKAIATQTSTMFNWLVEGNADDKTSLTLTSTMAELITDSLVIKDSTGSSTIISGGTIDLETLFAQNITATNLHITGNSTFDGIISAPTGNIAGFTINDTGLLSSVAKLYSSYSGQGRIELTNTDSNYKLMACDWGLTIDNTAVDSTVSNVYLGFIGSGHVSLQLASKNQTNSESNYVSISTDGSYINLNHTKESYMILSPVVTSTTGEIRANEGYYTGNTSLCENVLTFSHGGGWYMTDATWVRSYNNISIYTGGKVRGDGGLEVHGLGNSGGQVKMLYGDYGVILRNDGSSFYLLQTAKGDSGGTWNSYRPFYVNLSSGQVGINGSIFQTDMTMIRGGSYALSFRLSSSNNHVFRPTTTAGADADNIVYLGAGASRFHTVYSTNGVKSSSDERDKNVFGLDERHKQLLMSLRVISYTWKDDDSKIHVGVSAQQTEKALVSCGFNPDTFGALEHDFWDIPHADGRTDRYSVNYDEIAMLMLPVVQSHENYITTLDFWKNSVDYQLEQAQIEIAELKEKIALLKASA